MSKTYIAVREDRQHLIADGRLGMFDKLLAVLLGRKSPSLAQEVGVDRTTEDPSERELLGDGRAE